MPGWRQLHLLQGAHCGCLDFSGSEAGVHGCRRRLCAALKAICTCFGVPFAAAVVQPVATAAAATPPSAPEPVTHPILEEVSPPLVCSRSAVCICHQPTLWWVEVDGVLLSLFSATIQFVTTIQPVTCPSTEDLSSKQVSLLKVHSLLQLAQMLGCCLCLPL